ncbi:MAG: helix-turn-helix transcriptional regulator [Deltaproteobacteria bacterium]|nr:helix-turn-helix transcriptional regulator [Deltaproteobacteria bacterium]
MSPRSRRKPPDYRLQLGRRIAEIRRRSGLSQAALAEALGIATESLSRVERAVSVPSLGLLEGLAGTLGVTVEDLFSSRSVAPRMPLDPDVATLVALVRSKPPALRRQVLRLVRLFLAR